MKPGDTCRKAGTTPGPIAAQRAPAAKRRIRWRKIFRACSEFQRENFPKVFFNRLWKKNSKHSPRRGDGHRRSAIWAGVKPRFAGCVAGPDCGPPDGLPRPAGRPHGSGFSAAPYEGSGGTLFPRRRGPGEAEPLLASPRQRPGRRRHPVEPSSSSLHFLPSAYDFFSDSLDRGWAWS